MSVDALLTRLNPLVAAILRSPAHWLLSSGLMLLGFTGRKSGRQFTIPVGYQRDGDQLCVMVSEAANKRWWRNYRQAGPVTLRLRGREKSGTARLVAPGTQEFRERAERSLRRLPGLARVFRLEGFDRRAGLTREQLAQLGREIAVVHIDLDP